MAPRKRTPAKKKRLRDSKGRFVSVTKRARNGTVEPIDYDWKKAGPGMRLGGGVKPGSRRKRGEDEDEITTLPTPTKRSK